MLITYPDARNLSAHMHPQAHLRHGSCHAHLHSQRAAPIGEHCTILGALHQLGRGVMLPKWCNTTKEQELSRRRQCHVGLCTRRGSDTPATAASRGGCARHEPPTRLRRALPGPHVAQNPHCPQLKLLRRASQITTRRTLALQVAAEADRRARISGDWATTPSDLDRKITYPEEQFLSRTRSSAQRNPAKPTA